MAHEIHDGLIPLLFAARSATETLAASDFISDQDRDTAKMAAGWIRDAMDLCRGLLHDAHLPELTAANWREQAQRLVSRLHPSECRLAWNWSATIPPVPESALVSLYRITIEAVRNALRHSGARSIVVTDGIGDDASYAVSIRDDGDGFDLRSLGQESFGIRGMRHRAKLAGLGFAIESQLGGPTEVTVTAPQATDAAAKMAHS